MATATIEITLPGLTGFTLTLDLYPLGSDTAAVSGLSLTEATNRKGTYTTTTTAGLSGVYLAVAKEGTTIRGEGYVGMSDTANVHVVGIDLPGKVLGGGSGTISGVGAMVSPFTGTAPFSVTIRAVDADGMPVENAMIRLSRTGQSRSDLSDAAGEVELGCVAATWTVAIEASGFVFSPTTLLVTGDTEQEYELTAISLETSEPGKVTGWAYVYDANGALDPGQAVSIKTVRSTVASGMFAGSVRTTTANASGIAQFANLFPGNTYAVKYGTGEWINVEIPSTATSTYQIGRAIGPE